MIKNTLNDGKDDEYKLVYKTEQKNSFSLPLDSVYLYKNNTFISKKTSNHYFKYITNEIWTEMAYNRLSDTEKDALKEDINDIKGQLVDEKYKKGYSTYPDIFKKQTSDFKIKSYDGPYDKSAGL